MLEKHKNLIEKNILNNNEVNNAYSMVGSNNDYSFEVVGNELKVICDDDVLLENKNDGNISVWNVENNGRKISIIINKIDSLDVVAMIAIIDCNSNDFVAIKQTPTKLYVSYDENSISYDVNNCSCDLYINIMEDYFNKKGMLVGSNREDIFKFIRVDVNDIFTILYSNKNNYISNLERELNNLSANYVIESEKIKMKLKTICGYKKHSN